MKKFFVEQSQISQETITISGAQHEHLAKVLRTKAGEEIVCLTGDDFEYYCKVLEVGKKETRAKILRKSLCARNPKASITIFQGLAKGEKLDLITQKATELGASALIPFESHFTIAKTPRPKTDRLTKITQESCKQCGRSKAIRIFETINLKDIKNHLAGFDLVLFFYERAPENQTLSSFNTEILAAQNIAIIVGAEGGFSEDEAKILISLQAKEISLGKRILRTETASIAVCAYINFLKNN